MTISLCMIVKNEEAVLARCLESVQGLVEEIIIVDTGSTDATVDIARRFTSQVHTFAWIQDFAAARNFAFSKATMDYQLWLDADDVLPQSEHAAFLQLKNTLSPDVDMVTMAYHTHFDKNGNPTFTATRERLLRREKNFRWVDPVHECIPLCGNIVRSDIAIHHRKPPSDTVCTRNLDIYEALAKKNVAFSPRQLYYYARELKDHGQWEKAAVYFERFLDTGLGWEEDNIGACFCLSGCYRELGQTEKALAALLRSFRFGTPRAELCCEIGYWHKREKRYDIALAWFQIAAGLGPPNTQGFVMPDYWGYIPNVECCVCCCALQRYADAARYNQAAAAYKPNSAVVQHNKAYLDAVLRAQTQRPPN